MTQGMPRQLESLVPMIEYDCLETEIFHCSSSACIEHQMNSSAS